MCVLLAFIYSFITVSVVSVYEDKKGTIWFTHGADATHTVGLSYYEQKSLLESNPVATQAFFGGKMLWGITEDNEGNTALHLAVQNGNVDVCAQNLTHIFMAKF